MRKSEQKMLVEDIYRPFKANTYPTQQFLTEDCSTAVPCSSNCMFTICIVHIYILQHVIMECGVLRNS